MKEYTGFASVYDELMDNVPYEEWCEYIRSILSSYGINDGLVLDLGCGSGKLTEMLAGKGYDMIGVDNSEDMLMMAMEKKYESGHDILYLLQDMRDFELYGTVRAIVSACDCINYITEPDDLLHVFKLVKNYLDDDGVFIFDINTEYKYSEILSDNTFAENREECSFIWENYYDSSEKINEYDLTIFVKAESDDFAEGELYERFEETHYQRAYLIDEIKDLLKKAGLEVVDIYDAYSKNAPNEHSERVSVIAKIML